jgi:hypothetical protein
MLTVADILAYFGGATAILTCLAAFSYALFRLFATKWIETRFSERLEAFRHEQAKELEHLRFRISAQLDRINKLHQQELEALPQLWALANKAYAHAFLLASRFGFYPELEHVGDVAFLEQIETSKLSKSQKTELKMADRKERTSLYRRFCEHSALLDAEAAMRECNVFFTSNMIFFSNEISGKMAEFVNMLGGVLLSERLPGAERRRLAERSQYDLLLNDGEALLREVGTLIRDRLWTRDALEPDELRDRH